MQEIAAVQKIEAIKKTNEFSKTSSLKKNSSDKPSFAQLVTRAQNEKLEKQKSDKIKIEKPSSEKKAATIDVDEKKLSSEKVRDTEDENIETKSNLLTDETVSEEKVSKAENAANIPTGVDKLKQNVPNAKNKKDESEEIVKPEIRLENVSENENLQTEKPLPEVTLQLPENADAEAENKSVPIITGFRKSENIQAQNFALLEDASASEMPEVPLVNTLENTGEKKAKKFSLSDDGKITVLDLRTEAAAINANAKTVASAKKVSFAAEAQTATENPRALFTENAQMLLQNLSHENTHANGTDFQTLLMNQIQARTGDFVEAGKIILHDSDRGTINLILKPESLGNVKIHLELTDKGVRGEIVVRSQEAFDAFKNSGESLRHAFEQSGFENASFSLSYGGSGAHQNAGGNFSHEEKNANFAFSNLDAYETETDVSAAVGGAFSRAVNVLA